jgi:hypothetical protein
LSRRNHRATEQIGMMPWTVQRIRTRARLNPSAELNKLYFCKAHVFMCNRA